ncbi:SseB family protein [Lysobacter xanthus]
MTTVTDLRRLKERALADPAREVDYLRALLDATLYAHAPVSDDSGKLHFLMFTRPDGLNVIPLFTELAQAQDAARNAARVIPVQGRQMLEATRGATLMLDPNDVGMTLYPEEVATLLDAGEAAIAPASADGPDLELQAPDPGDAWLMDVIAKAVEPIAAVMRLHLAAARPKGSTGEADRLLVIAAVPPAWGERASRAIATAIFKSGRPPRLAVDLATYEPGDALAASMDQGLRVAWSRELRSSAASCGG